MQAEVWEDWMGPEGVSRQLPGNEDSGSKLHGVAVRNFFLKESLAIHHLHFTSLWSELLITPDYITGSFVN